MNSTSFLRQRYTPNPPKYWRKKDEGSNKFYVYILKLDSGELYIGQTRELRERILEHQEGTTRSTAGEHPKLRYFEILPTREAAMLREHEIRILVKNNRREIFRMITEFNALISVVDKSI
jgi:predicted GIY-YIG superfamily endonuclease